MSSSDDPAVVASPFILGVIPLRTGIGRGAPNAAGGGLDLVVSGSLF